MLPVIFLIAYDTLPPIPFPSDLRCPEPAVRFETDADSLESEAYYGEYYGVSFFGRRSGLSLDAGYAHDEKWLAGQDGRVNAAIAFPVNRLWIRPFIEGSWSDRIADYRRIGAGFETASDLPWLILESGFQYNRWLMPGVYQEAEGYLSIYGDRFSYIPQIDLNAVSRGEDWTFSAAAWVHIGSFHAGLGSPLNRGFPAPRGDIEFRNTRMVFAIGIQQGRRNLPFSEYFKPDEPYRYRLPLAAEESKIGIDGRGRLRIGTLILGGNAAYIDWQTRLAPDDSFYLMPVHDLSEWRADLFISFARRFARLEVNQVLYLRYDKTSVTIANEPKYALTDTLEIVYGPVFTILEIKYLHPRAGVERPLPRVLLIDPKIGLRWNSLEVFCAVYNLNNFRGEIYEGYYPGSIKAVAGIGIKL